MPRKTERSHQADPKSHFNWPSKKGSLAPAKCDRTSFRNVADRNDPKNMRLLLCCPKGQVIKSGKGKGRCKVGMKSVRIWKKNARGGGYKKERR